MGGRKPTSPKIIPGKFPTPEGGPAPINFGGGIGVGGGPGIPPRFPGGKGKAGARRDPIRGGKRGPRKPRGPRRPIKGIRFIGTPPPGYEFNENDRLVKRVGKGGARRDPIRGGRGTRSCPDPSMLILMADGSQKKAGDLVVGDLVKTHHEKSFELGNYEVEYVNIVEDVEKIKLTFDQSEIICSLTHKFYVDNTWKEAKDMVVDDVVSDKKLTAIEKVEEGDVVHITVKDAHTYICEGLLSHNKRFIRPPRGPRGPRGPKRPPKDGPSIMPLPPKDRPSIMPIPPKNYDPRSGVRYTDRGIPTAVQETIRIPVKDPTLGGPPEREVPIRKERLPAITRESDPTGPAPFAPDERGMVRDRFFERMFEKADEAKQKKSMQKEERQRARQARNEEIRARRMQPGEINVGNERQEIRRSMREERAARRMQPGEIDVGGEIDINAERGGRRRGGGMRRNRRGRNRDFTRRRSRMQGGRRGRSMEERAAFRDRYVSTLGGGFFS